MQRVANAAQSRLRASPFQIDGSTERRPHALKIAWRLLLLGPQLALDALKFTLPMSIFFFKFLEWWYSSSYVRSRLSSTKSVSSIPALKAPETRLLPHCEGVLGGREDDTLPAGTCPICRKQITNPTALPTGWVGDYRCLYDYVEKEGKCPITRLKVSVGDLRKING